MCPFTQNSLAKTHYMVMLEINRLDKFFWGFRRVNTRENNKVHNKNLTLSS